jgi:hypothetical protein
MIQFYDIVKPWECKRLWGESLDEWRERMIEEYTPHFRELTLLNESMGNMKRPIHDVLQETEISLDEFCIGYVEQCFECIIKTSYIL